MEMGQQHHISNLKAQHTDELDTWKDQYEAAELRIHELNNKFIEINTLRREANRANKLQSDIEHFKLKNSELGIELDNLKKQVQQKETETEQMLIQQQQEKAGLSQQVESLKQELERLKKQQTDLGFPEPDTASPEPHGEDEPPPPPPSKAAGLTPAPVLASSEPEIPPPPPNSARPASAPAPDDPESTPSQAEAPPAASSKSGRGSIFGRKTKTGTATDGSPSKPPGRFSLSRNKNKASS